MLEKITYINHLNETLEFGKDCLFANENDLRDFAWEITSRNNRISGFKKGIVQKTIPVIMKCWTEEEGLTLRNMVFEVFEKDVLAKKPGKLCIGDYYMWCYITGSQNAEYLIHKSLMTMTLMVSTDTPMWLKETTKDYLVMKDNAEEALDFPYDYSHDYRNTLAATSIFNGSFAPSNFILQIEGYVVNPTIYIANHKYSVNVTVDEGDILTIDSINKTITLNRNGEITNCFKNRSKDSYVFEKIPAGFEVVTSPNDHLKFTLTLIEERSEPKWT